MKICKHVKYFDDKNTNLNGNTIISVMETHGLKARLVNLKILEAIKTDIENRFRCGEIDETLFKRYFSNFDYTPPTRMFEAKSILVIAIPRPQFQAEFILHGEEKTLLIPPTYTGYNDIPANAIKFIKDACENFGYKFERASLPHKSLAVRSGLAFYGRNNITFIPEFGSYYQLASYYTTLTDEVGEPQAPRILERCKNCVACIKVCPTNAITKERFLIHAEKCLTYFNENAGDFPEWISSDAHNSLIGCIMCQKFCPENKQVRNWLAEKNCFSESDTENILSVNDFFELPEEVQNKLRELDLIDTHITFKSLQRNMKVMLYEKANDL